MIVNVVLIPGYTSVCPYGRRYDVAKLTEGHLRRKLTRTDRGRPLRCDADKQEVMFPRRG